MTKTDLLINKWLHSHVGGGPPSSFRHYMLVLEENPEGITSARMAEIRGVTRATASANLGYLFKWGFARREQVLPGYQYVYFLADISEDTTQ